MSVFFRRRGKAQLVLDAIFANNTWAAIITACQSGNVPDSWAVGDSKMMTINGTDYQIDIIGKNHDTYTAGGKAPLTFQMHNCYANVYSMYNFESNKYGWTNCTIRTGALPKILALMPSEVQSGIREVNKLTSAGDQSATIKTTADKLFLLSEVEIFGSTTYAKSGEGSQYDYYKAGNSKVKHQGSNKRMWWERSPRGDNSENYCRVTTMGTAGSDAAHNTNYVAFAFCF